MRTAANVSQQIRRFEANLKPAKGSPGTSLDPICQKLLTDPLRPLSDIALPVGSFLNRSADTSITFLPSEERFGESAAKRLGRETALQGGCKRFCRALYQQK
jgi:hypothetical protein